MSSLSSSPKLCHIIEKSYSTCNFLINEVVLLFGSVVFVLEIYDHLAVGDGVVFNKVSMVIVPIEPRLPSGVFVVKPQKCCKNPGKPVFFVLVYLALDCFFRPSRSLMVVVLILGSLNDGGPIVPILERAADDPVVFILE